jgi:hypothetical protein
MSADNARQLANSLPIPLTRAEKEALIALIRERNQDPEYREYLERGNIAAEEYRHKANDEARRQLDEEGK